MRYRPLGNTGMDVSVLSFGAGPVAELMTAPERCDDQRHTLARALELGINWIDTAATYGEGQSEANLGAVLQDLGESAAHVHVATKVRLPPEQLGDIADYILRSVEASLTRLKRSQITLLQLHNSVTPHRGDEPTSITPHDVLSQVLPAMRRLRCEGVVRHLGLTGLGHPQSLAKVLDSREFVSVQIPYNLLNPSAGQRMPADFTETDYGNLLAVCQSLNVGAFAIRVFAGGALAGKPPSRHTLTTQFFPLDLYQRDLARAAELRRGLPPETNLAEVALRFPIAHPAITSALVGFASPQEVEQAATYIQQAFA